MERVEQHVVDHGARARLGREERERRGRGRRAAQHEREQGPRARAAQDQEGQGPGPDAGAEVLGEDDASSDQRPPQDRRGDRLRGAGEDQQAREGAEERRPLVVAQDVRGVDQDHEGRGRQQAPAAPAHARGQRVDQEREDGALQHHGQGQATDAGPGHEQDQGMQVDHARAHELEEVPVHDLAREDPGGLVEEDTVAPDVEGEDGRQAP